MSKSHKMKFCIERLISEVEARPCIWDSRTAIYSERAAKKAAWEDLCASFVPEYYVSSDAERHGIIATFQKKWKGVRDAFLRELKKNNAGNKYLSKQYAYYENLLFLKPVCDTKSNKNDDDSNNESMNVEYENNVDSDNEPPDSVNITDHRTNCCQQPVKRRRTEGDEDRMYNMIEDHLKKKRDGQNDPDRQFLLSLLPDLQSIDPRIKFDLKFEIMRIMKTYKVEHLKLVTKQQK